MSKLIEKIKEKIDSRKERIELMDQKRVEKLENEKEIIDKINELKSLIKEKEKEYSISHDDSMVNEIVALKERLEELRKQLLT
jgi:nucleoid-associated protein YejK